MMFRVLFVCLLVASSVALHAQQPPTPASSEAEAVVPVRVLEIHAGQVFLDGEALPASHVPADLDLEGLDMIYQFSGPVTPVLEFDGVVYVLMQAPEGARLQLLSDTERRDAQVYFMGQPDTNAMARAAAATPEPMPEDDLIEAGEEAYLRQLSSRDRPLYEQIRSEQSLERETLRLADQVRRNADPIARGRLINELRLKLGASFDLKQRIRANEITQAEEQIAELRRLLNEREARKQQIIERRLRDLVGGD
ncbi:MAG: hypothetical protein HKN04_05190 [Rhodothermaceae bacterium]|nr:hypothetical protein [Rhodothermaceae bacterium]